MNNDRRQQLRDLADRINDVKEDLENIMQEEKEYRDEMPENLQSGQRYEESEEWSGQMEAVLESLENAVNDIEYLGL
jgi:flagellar biosynthesis chaperone FliJ